MKTLAFKVSFFEALFRVHYTQAFKLSYPIPLPTTIMGFFGNMLGYDRKEVTKALEGFLYGAKFLSGDSIEENVTFLQWKIDDNRVKLYKKLGIQPKGKLYTKGVVKYQILNNVSYIFFVAGEEKELENKILSRIKLVERDEKTFIVIPKRYPYGGQNDFFTKEILLLTEDYEIKESKTVKGGYIDAKNIELVKDNTSMEILPVRTKQGLKYFGFIKEGEVETKKELLTVNNVPIYSINDFYYY